MDGTPPGECQVTTRGRSAAWCECAGVTAGCSLTCPNGSPPPNMTKYDPAVGKTCELFAYEFSMLTANECPNSTAILNFDATAFCCPDVPSPNNCNICSPTQTPADPSTLVLTAQFGNITCAELAAHVSYLPPGQANCDSFVFLLNNPQEGNKCCINNPGGIPSSTTTTKSSSALKKVPFFSLWLLSVASLISSLA